MKFYGLSFEIGGGTEYLACFEADAYESIEGLEEISLPGGKYARYILKNLEKRSESIGEIFPEMTKHNKAEKNGYYIEFYRSRSELILMVPVE